MTCEIEYETVAAYAAGDLAAGMAEEFLRHMGACPACKERLKAIRAADAALAGPPLYSPTPEALLAVRRRLSQELRGSGPEIMTLQEVREFMRLTPEQLGEAMESLPAFELGGQVRIRRARLIEWIEQRERDYRRQANESWVERAGVTGLGKGVA